MIKKLPVELFNEIYRQVPRLCVDIIIYTSQGIVLTKRLIPPCIGMWHIPGGTVLLGEKLEEAVNRIANEEIGVDVKIKNMMGIIEYLELFNYSVGVVFLCELKPEEQEFRGSFQAEEIKAFKTIPDNTIVEQKKFLKLKLEQSYNGNDVKYEKI